MCVTREVDNQAQRKESLFWCELKPEGSKEGVLFSFEASKNISDFLNFFVFVCFEENRRTEGEKGGGFFYWKCQVIQPYESQISIDSMEIDLQIFSKVFFGEVKCLMKRHIFCNQTEILCVTPPKPIPRGSQSTVGSKCLKQTGFVTVHFFCLGFRVSDPCVLLPHTLQNSNSSLSLSAKGLRRIFEGFEASKASRRRWSPLCCLRPRFENNERVWFRWLLLKHVALFSVDYIVQWESRAQQTCIRFVLLGKTICSGTLSSVTPNSNQTRPIAEKYGGFFHNH